MGAVRSRIVGMALALANCARCDLESSCARVLRLRLAPLLQRAVKPAEPQCEDVDLRRQRRPAHRGPLQRQRRARRIVAVGDAGPRPAQRQPQPLRNRRRAQTRRRNYMVERRDMATARRHALRALLASRCAGALAHVGAGGAVSEPRLRRRARIRLLVRARPVVAHVGPATTCSASATARRRRRSSTGGAGRTSKISSVHRAARRPVVRRSRTAGPGRRRRSRGDRSTSISSLAVSLGTRRSSERAAATSSSAAPTGRRGGRASWRRSRGSHRSVIEGSTLS